MKTVKNLLLALAMLAMFWLPASQAFAFNPFCTTDASGACISGPCKDNPTAPTCQSASAQNGSNSNPVVNIINTAANIIALITGVAAVVMIIVGGLTMVTSGGNTESVAKARRRVIFSAVGLIVVALAWTITRFITDKVI